MAVSEEVIKDYNKSRRVMDKSMPCYAPATSLNFEQGGTVTACCYNRTFVLGKYPEDTLRDIWAGEKRQELNSFLKEYDFSHGCQLCEHQLRSGNYQGSRMHGYDTYVQQDYLRNTIKNFFGYTDKLEMPRSMEFEIDNTCNLECVMCNGKFSSLIRKNRENLPPIVSPYDEAFVAQLESFIPHLHEAKFLGGEPFLTPLYYSIWERIKQLNPKMAVSITTNATVLTKKVKQVLEDLNVNAIISIDSLEKDRYEQIRINAKFERVQENLKFYEAYAKKNNRPLSFAICPMTLNWEELPAIQQYCNQNNIKVYYNTVVEPVQYSLRSLLQGKLNEIRNFLSEKIPVAQNAIARRNNIKYNHLLQQINQWAKEAEEKERILSKLKSQIENQEFSKSQDINQFLDMVIRSQHLYLFEEVSSKDHNNEYKDSIEHYFLSKKTIFTSDLIKILAGFEPKLSRDNHPNLSLLQSFIDKSNRKEEVVKRLLSVGLHNVSNFLATETEEVLLSSLQKEFGN